jgi:hypothetical protein
MWRSSSSSPENISTSERGRRKIFYRDVLKAYFKALEKADELDPASTHLIRGTGNTTAKRLKPTS